jgi:hypothetical protein
MMLKFTVLAALLLTAATLPNGVDTFRWGMSVDELIKQAPAQKVELGHGYGYTEHAEANPDVYAQASDGQRHREYYFFRGKLYKIFTVYHRNLTQPEFYASLLAGLKKQHGEPARSYEDQAMGLPVRHVEWKDEHNTIDLRMGAGFIFEVRFDNAAAAEKKVLNNLKQSI